MDRRNALQALTVFFGLLGAGCAREESEQMLRDLRSGDLVLYMRHAATDETRESRKGTYEDCSWQRNLSAAGRSTATAMGRSIQALKLPVESVYASPMCRTMETAKLVFGRATAVEVLRTGGGQLPDGRLDVTPIMKMWAESPSPGRITAIVGHENPDLGFKPLLNMAETAVIRPTRDSYSVLGRVGPDQWAKWAE